MSKLFLSGLALAGIATVLLAQTPAAAPTFEVASIKPAPPLDPAKIMAGKLKIGMNIDAARVDIGSLSLADLVNIAYKVKPHQVTGPDWLGVQRFDIVAKMPEGSNKDQVPEMIQALLADRFKLAIHRDSKEQSVYALVVGKNGVKMKEAPPDTPPPPAGADSEASAGPPGSGGQVVGTGDGQVRMKPSADGKGMVMSNKQMGNMKFTRGDDGVMRMEFERISMTMLIGVLSGMVDRPLVDMTELKANYHVVLELSMEEMMTMARANAQKAGISLPMQAPKPEAGRAPGDAASTPSTASIFTSIQQLGLKLEPRKAPVEMIVIDHVEKMPTEN